MLEKIHEIHFDEKQIKPGKITVMVCQLKFSDFAWEIIGERYYHKTPSQVRAQLDSFFEVAVRDNVDLLIFPELSIPESLIGFIRDWSGKHYKTVVAGSHYIISGQQTFSRCPVIIAGSVFFTEKLNPAPIELSPIAEGNLASGREFLVFKDTPVGNFAVFICSDFLSADLTKAIREMDLDFFCIPAFQKDSNIYYERMNVICEESDFGIYLFYANFLEKGHADGSSAIFGVLNKMYVSKLLEAGFTDLNPKLKLFQMSNEANYVSASIDLKFRRPYANPNAASVPNVVIQRVGDGGNRENFDFARAIGRNDERYLSIDKLFVAPSDLRAIQKLLEDQKLIFITGDPGIGKTYTAVKLLKEYFSKGYRPIWHSGIDNEERRLQGKLLLEYVPKEKEVVYFEDPFGRTNFERRDSLYHIFNVLHDRIRNIDCRIIVSSRKEIFEKFISESLTGSELTQLTKELNVISPAYSKISLVRILRVLAQGFCKWHDIPELKSLVYESIFKGQLITPLAIRSFVFASSNTEKKQELIELLQKRQREQNNLFAAEIMELDISSKVLLVCIFLPGFTGMKYFVNLYTEIVNEFKESQKDLEIISYSEALKRQIGFRVEQYGNEYSGFRLSHPVYEEALMEGYKNSAVIKKVFDLVILKYCHDIPVRAYTSISRLISRDIEVGYSLFTLLMENNYELRHDKMQVSIAERIINLYKESNEPKLLNLVNRFVTVESLMELISSSNSLHVKFHSIKLLQKIKNLPGVSDFSFSNLNLDHALELMAEEARNYPFILHFLKLTNVVFPDFVKQYQKRLGLKGLLPILFRMKSSERDQFIEMFVGSADEAKLREYSTFFNENPIDDHDSRLNYSDYKDLIIRLEKYGGELIVDPLAAKAVKNRNNLLPIGILGVTGQFESGEVVKLRMPDQEPFAIGIANYSSTELNIIKGSHSSKFSDMIGYIDGPAAVYQNYITFLK